MSKSLKPKVLSVVGVLLRLMSSPFGTVLLFGTAGLSWRYPFIQSFVDLSLERREKALLSWVHSSLGIYCTLFKMFSFYGRVSPWNDLPA